MADEISITKAKPKSLPQTTRIMLEENETIPPNGLYIGHNGRGYLLRPGEEVNAPNALLEILDNAITSTPVVDPQTRQVVGHRPKLRYPYRVIAARAA